MISMHICENYIYILIFSYHNETNRNSNILKDFITKNNLLRLNTHFQNKSAQLWTHKSSIDYLSQVDYVS